VFQSVLATKNAEHAKKKKSLPLELLEASGRGPAALRRRAEARSGARNEPLAFLACLLAETSGNRHAALRPLPL
jgi:hypothetical protein